MDRQAIIFLLADPDPRFASELRDEAFNVRPLGGPADVPGQTQTPDLVLIDASTTPGFIDAVRVCRRRWPGATTPVLVVGSPGPAASAEAIEAGASDCLVNSLDGPLVAAHVRRLLRAGETLRVMLDDERRRTQRESLAQAAADVAVPLGEMLDELEAVMAETPVDPRFDGLLELTGRAVDVVDRLRRQATSVEGA